MMMRDLGGELAELLETARASGVAIAGPLRLVYGEASPSGLSMVPVLTARVSGACRCVHGYLYSDDGRATRCPDCGPMWLVAERTTAARLPAWTGRVREEWRDPSMPPAELARWASHVLAGRRGPLLHGACGTGKTWRAVALALALVDAGATVRWVSWPALPHVLRLAYAAGRTTSDMLRPLMTADVLVLDDVGAEAGKREWLDDLALQVLGPRADNRSPIIVTTNLAPAQLAESVGSRAWSRLNACCRSVEVGGADRRTN
jgi:hypothetical protein